MTEHIIDLDNAPVYIAVDIGGTSTRVGLFHMLDAPGFTLITRFLTRRSYDEQMHQIIASIQNSGARQLAGIGVSIAGRIAKDGRSVIVAPNF